MNCNTTHYRANSSSVPGDPTRAWLAELERDDPALAEDLAELLAERSAVHAEEFLEGSAAPSPPPLGGQTLRAPAGACGAWELVAPIGEGGMGSVWLARRSDGRFEGRAAVKLLNPSLVGRSGEERFRREGSILARLAHPHIARLLDAGVSPLGQPYLVLEYVEGKPIDRSCDERGLGVPARLRLFLEVLDAVAHAHASLVVHRDIKPSNVLVGEDGRVKLLDFGIAKLLDDDERGAETALTRDGGRAMTPEFAAPEQLTGGPVTTATDVHALGTLLYVLLGGKRPTADSRSPADLFRAIVEIEPPRLSAAAPERFRRLVEGDLETIVAKALKKLPEERYASVTAFADDVRRHLEHQPIRARPDAPGYRLAKFVRRHRIPAALAALSVLTLAAGLLGTLTQARRATRQAAVAEAERSRADLQAREAAKGRDFALKQLSRAEAINDLNAFLLSDVGPAGKPFTVTELLERAESVVAREKAETDENRVEMMIGIGAQYWSRDEDDKSRRILEGAYALAGKLPDRTLQAKAACALSAVVARGDAARGEALAKEGLAGLPDEPQHALDRVFCLSRASYVSRESGEVGAAVERIEEARRLLEASGLSTPLRELTIAIDVAESYRMAGRPREADAAFRSANELLVSLGRDGTEKAGTLLNNWGLTLYHLGRPLEAERVFRRAVAVSRGDGGPESVSPMLLTNLARTLVELQRLDEAVPLVERAHAAARAKGDEVVVNQSLLLRAAAYRERKELPRAASALGEVGPRLAKMLPAGHVAFAALAEQRALVAAATGDEETAARELERGVAIASAGPQGAESLPRLLVRRSAIALARGRVEEARADAERALELERKRSGAGDRSCRIGRAHAALGRALDAAGEPERARAALASALEHLAPTLGEEHPETRSARAR